MFYYIYIIHRHIYWGNFGDLISLAPIFLKYNIKFLNIEFYTKMICIYYTKFFFSNHPPITTRNVFCTYLIILNMIVFYKISI